MFTFEAFPRRIFMVGQRPPVYDPDGFVLPLPRSEVLPATELLSHPAVLVVAPPWTGKTFVARQLHHALAADPPPSISFGSYFALSSFEIGRGSPIPPLWWEDWQKGSGRACWLVDAVDEDLRLGGERIDTILARIAELSPEVRSRLHLILFARANEVPPVFLEHLEDLFGRWSGERPEGLRRVRLAGLDREEALALVGKERFQEVCQRIRQNGLADLASLPSVLEHLRENVSVSLNREEVWRGVLADLLREWRGRERLDPSPDDIEDRFEVVQRLAALVTFNGARELGFPTRPGALELEDLLPSTLPSFRVLRQAAFEVLKTAVFERTESGGFRFAQDHVREWFAAFALQALSLPRVRPLLVDDSGNPEPIHRGILGTLARISIHRAVRDWIAETHGGVVPPSDAAPWSLPEATRSLDRLQELASSSSWGLDLWREEERLRHFVLPGMGAEIARRLDLSLPPAEQQLLLEIARVVGAQEPLRPAERLLAAGDARVRGLAAELILQHGTEKELAPLALEARTAPPSTRGVPWDVLVVLVPRFLEMGLWKFETAAELALRHSDLLEAQWLQMTLVQDIALDQARWLVRQYVLPSPRSLAEPLLGDAFRALVGQERLSPKDYELLRPLALTWEERVGNSLEGYLGELQRAFKREPAARRTLFLDGLQLAPQSHQGSRVWSFLLKAEDTEWLLDLIRKHAGKPAWLLELLYFRSREPEVGRHLRTRARNEIRKWRPGLVEDLDRDRPSWEAKERRRLRERDLDLAILVRQTLDDLELDLTGKMWRLSWSCFVSPGLRLSPVSGRFEDLTDDLRREALSLCGRAIDECLATPIPEGENLPEPVHWEAACFHRMASGEAAFVLSGLTVQRWLPTLLAAWDSTWEPTLYRCFEVDRPASEDRLVEALRREIRAGRGSALLGRLPPELWSERLAARLAEEIVESEDHPPALRIELLVRIARISKGLAEAIALRWADREVTTELGEAGLDILLAVAPERGWPRLKERLEKHDPAWILLRLRSLRRHPAELNVDLAAWPGELLGELAGRLLCAFPSQLDPLPVSGTWWPSAEAELRSLGYRIPSLLFQRNQPNDATALESLARSQPGVRQWLDQARAQQGAQGVLSGVGREPLTPLGPLRAVPLPRLVKLLQDERYRILRTVEDLQAVILEELQALALDARQHLALLYQPLDRERGSKRRRLHEEALQTYICCRLRDRLLPTVLDPRSTTLLVDREPLAARNTRNDIKVQAVAQDNKPLAVIVEIKWSDHEDLSTAQVEQLAKQYLLENGLTHGIYLTGWCGEAHWKTGALGEPPVNSSSMDSWRKALEGQARLLQERYPSLNVKPFLLNLTWEEL